MLTVQYATRTMKTALHFRKGGDTAAAAEERVYLAPRVAAG